MEVFVMALDSVQMPDLIFRQIAGTCRVMPDLRDFFGK